MICQKYASTFFSLTSLIHRLTAEQKNSIFLIKFCVIVWCNCPLYLFELYLVVITFVQRVLISQLFGTNLTLIFKILPPLKFFKRAPLKFICPQRAHEYKVHHPRGLKLLTWLQLGFIYMNINFDYLILMIQ